MRTLAQYPFVLVRIDCERCGRKGRYRLARLAERFGANTNMHEVLTALSANCPSRDPNAPSGLIGCGARFPDLTSGRPPDLPPGAGGRRTLRVVPGGRAA